MKAYNTAKAAHEANNEVLLAARKMAEERGVAMAIVVASQVEGAAHQTIGVEYTRAENIDLVCSIASAAVGALSKQQTSHQTEVYADHLAKMFVLGNHHAAEALDRSRVGDEAPPVTPEDVRLEDNAPVCPHCGGHANGEELYEQHPFEVDSGNTLATHCSKCSEAFTVERHITVTYSTRKT